MKIKQFLFIVLTILTVPSFLNSKQAIEKKYKNTLYKPNILSSNNFDGNRVDCDMMNNGMFVSHMVSGRSGLTWPKGNGTQTIYASGVWLGGVVDGEIRVSAGEYNGEFASGPWGVDYTDEQYKIYKVNKSDLKNPSGNEDFQNWPTEMGAPFVDNNNNGTYEPIPEGPDHPEFIGDQVLWMVMNDGVQDLHTVFHSAPLGVEVQRMVYGFDSQFVHETLKDMMFIKDLIINKGGNTIKDMYIGLWSDPDLGDASDDYVGCDTTLGMGICYNGGKDRNFEGFYGGTPAVGYDFFQGPMVPALGETAIMYGKEIPNMKNLQMTSFIKYIGGDPVYYDPNNAEEGYFYLQGLMPNGETFPFSGTGGTKFVHPGDPSLDTGPNDTEYVDADLHPSDDRRFLMSSGPFTMAPDDSQEVVYAILHAAAGDALSSYHFLKQVDTYAQFAYDSQFRIPTAPPEPMVSVTEFSDEFIFQWGNESENHSTEGPSTLSGEPTTYEFEGYNVYQSENIDGTGKIIKIATYDKINNIRRIFDDVYDDKYESYVNVPVQNGSDSGIKRSIIIDHDHINDAEFIVNREYYFAVSAYSYNEQGYTNALESPISFFEVRPQTPNTWVATDTTAIYGTVTDNGFQIVGESDGRVYAKVVDPTLLTGDDYELFFWEETYFQNIDGKWINEYPANKKAIEKILDCTGSTITFSAVRANNGTYNLFFNLHMDCGTNWVDGIELVFPSGVVINSWTPIVQQPIYGSDQGQNCGNMDGTLNGTTIIYGDNAQTGFGCIHQDKEWIVNIDPIDIPFSVNYAVYDDGYDGTIADAVSVAEISFAKKKIEGWYVRNINTHEIVTPHTTIRSGIASDNIIDGSFVPGYEAGYDENPIAEGLQFIVESPQQGINRVSEFNADESVILDANVGVYPPSLGTTGYFLSHRDHANAAWAGRTHDRFGYWGNDDVIIDFGETSLGYDYLAETINGEVPYSVYRQKFSTGERVRLVAGYWEYDGDGEWSVTEPWGDYGAPGYEPIYAWQGYDAEGNEISYDPANEAQYLADNSLLTSFNCTWGGGIEEIQYPFLTATLMVLYLDGSTPPWGNKIMIITSKPMVTGDKFQLATSHLVGKIIDYNIDNIKVWPNPYFAYNPEERSRFNQEIHFTHLPETGECTIRIFDLVGNLIRKIEHTNGTQFEIWDVRNDYNWKIASGMYIVHIETEVGEKILKLAVVQPSN